jgi:hypothetical protein
MTYVRDAGIDARRLGVLSACLLLAIAAEGLAQAPGTGGRSGGLLPGRETPSVSGGMTRDELLRRFDLDSDGRIDEAEAEAARARMRRERVDTMQKSGLDPLTGRPRAAGPAGPTRDATPPPEEDTLILPGAPTDPPPRKPVDDAEKNPAAKPAPSVPPGRAPPLTGGVRAGAPAVRQGYGAASPTPKTDLNAGRPRDPRPLTNGGQARPGMQPAGRPGPATPAPRGTAPRPSLFPQGSSRPTAEDFGR